MDRRELCGSSVCSPCVSHGLWRAKTSLVTRRTIVSGKYGVGSDSKGVRVWK